ncbi:hypothetical protein ATO67_12140 [Agrobacterium bohemicum]|uniref:Uncharacterized protein n=1 Tax=Agrobacterium bohemicum TaxID=2052828 RepID=A0A135NYQ2_9HYPH|nr:hypothetical protein ATO67_12140 [Agrobacterium bohemicum]
MSGRTEGGERHALLSYIILTTSKKICFGTWEGLDHPAAVLPNPHHSSFEACTEEPQEVSATIGASSVTDLG